MRIKQRRVGYPPVDPLSPDQPDQPDPILFFALPMQRSDRWFTTVSSGCSQLPSGKHTKNYGKSPFSMGQSTISMAIFNSYVTVITRGIQRVYHVYGSVWKCGIPVYPIFMAIKNGTYDEKNKKWIWDLGYPMWQTKKPLRLTYDWWIKKKNNSLTMFNSFIKTPNVLNCLFSHPQRFKPFSPCGKSCLKPPPFHGDLMVIQ